jgi:hypothetical protein
MAAAGLSSASDGDQKSIYCRGWLKEASGDVASWKPDAGMPDRDGNGAKQTFAKTLTSAL